MTTALSREAELAEKRRYWKQHIDEWRAGGQTQVSYCQNHNLCRHRFQYWKKRFHTPEQKPTFIELPFRNPLPGGHPAGSLCLMVGGRFRIAVERGFDPAALTQLIGVLEQL
jgi:hypothetical protein